MVSGRMSTGGLRGIDALRARIERWRRSRPRRGPMPEALWAEAVALTEDHGLHAVSRQLRLGYHHLKLRVVEAELEQERLGDAQPRGAGAVPEGFVEIQAGVRPGAIGTAGCAMGEIELVRPDGARMTVRVAAGQSVDVVSLTEAFFGVKR